MKQLPVITIISILLLGGCNGAGSAATPFNIAEIRRYAPGVNVAALSNAQIQTTLAIIHNGDDGEGRKALWVQSYLRKTGHY